MSASASARDVSVSNLWWVISSPAPIYHRQCPALLPLFPTDHARASPLPSMIDAPLEHASSDERALCLALDERVSGAVLLSAIGDLTAIANDNGVPPATRQPGLYDHPRYSDAFRLWYLGFTTGIASSLHAGRSKLPLSRSYCLATTMPGCEGPQRTNQMYQGDSPHVPMRPPCIPTSNILYDPYPLILLDHSSPLSCSPRPLLVRERSARLTRMGVCGQRLRSLVMYKSPTAVPLDRPGYGPLLIIPSGLLQYL